MLSILYQGKISKTGALKEKNRTLAKSIKNIYGSFSNSFINYTWGFLKAI